jgi:four helix bundle protein
MGTIGKFEEINAWILARELCKKVGEIIDKGSLKKNFRLIDQLEGSTGSTMDNIAEGFERGTRAEFIMFLGYAKGSCGEVRSQLHRAKDRKYLSKDEFENLQVLCKRISAAIQKLIEYLQQSAVAGVRKK